MESKETLQTISSDGVKVTFDYYKSPHINCPILILCHQAGYSRGEYIETAEYLTQLGFSCIAIDQRSGNEVNDIKNQTALDAHSKGKSLQYVDAVPDIEAAIAYADKEFPHAKKVLVGSSYSSSLAIILGVKHAKSLTAVASFSPGEYFTYEGNTVAEWAKELKLPIFITSAKGEVSGWKNIFSNAASETTVGYEPQGNGIHGSRNLWSSTTNHVEYRNAFESFLESLNLFEF